MPEITPEAQAVAVRTNALLAQSSLFVMKRETAKQQLAAARALSTLLYTSSPTMPVDMNQVQDALQRLDATTEAMAREIHVPLAAPGATA